MFLMASLLQLIRTRKPTGDGECPPEIERAHEINNKIQAKVACRDLGDDEIMEIKDSDNDIADFTDDDETSVPAHRPKPTLRVRTTRKETAPAPSRQPPTKGLDFLDRVAQSLNPEHQAQREIERTSSLFQSQQLILLHSQIRDLNQLVQTLRTQLDEAERRWVNADRRADRLQNQIDITSAVNRAQAQQPAVAFREPPITVSSDSNPGTPNSNHEPRWEAIYRDGGRTSWFGDENPRLDADDIVEVNRIPWSPSPRSPIQAPPSSDSE